MRLPIYVLILALWSPSVSAQSLGELARQERARRSLLGPARLVFTSSDLRPAPAPEGDPVAAAETFGDVLAGDEIDFAVESPAARLYEAQSALVLQLQDMEVAQQLEIIRIRERLAAPVATQRDRTQAQVELAAAESRLSDIRTQLEDARARLSDLESSLGEQPFFEN